MPFFYSSARREAHQRSCKFLSSSVGIFLGKVAHLSAMTCFQAMHQQKQTLYHATCIYQYHVCLHMLGRDDGNVDIGIKSLDELEAIGEETSTVALLFFVRTILQDLIVLPELASLIDIPPSPLFRSTRAESPFVSSGGTTPRSPNSQRNFGKEIHPSWGNECYKRSSLSTRALLS